MQGPVQTGETSPSSEKEEKPSFLLSWPPGFLFAMRRPLPGAWGHSRRSGRPRRPRGLLRLRAPVPAPGQRPAWAPGGRSGRRGRCLRAPPPGRSGSWTGPRAAPGAPWASRPRRKSQMESPGTGGLSAHGVTAAGAPVLGALTPRRVPPRAASDKVDCAAQCSRFHAANPDEPEPRFPCLHAAATLGPRGSRGAVVAQRCLPGLLAE